MKKSTVIVMRGRFGQLAVCFGLILIVATLTACAADLATVVGRVVGDDAKPVVGATVMIAYEGGYSVASGKSNSEGRFEITFSGPVKRRLFLYTGIDAIPRRHVDDELISVPFGGVLWGDKNFAGMPFEMGDKLTFDVGDVPLRFWFNDVHVRMTRDRRKLVAAEWERLWVRLKDQRGRVVYEGSFAPSIAPQADVESSEMRIMLPEGKWSFDFKRYIYGDVYPSAAILGQTPIFEIRRNNATTELCVELSDF